MTASLAQLALVVPVYKFEGRTDFEAYLASCTTVPAVIGRGGGKGFVSNTRVQPFTTQLIDERLVRRTDDPQRDIYRTLKAPQEVNPSGAEHAVLVWSGRRTVVFGSDDEPVALQPIAQEPRECFVAWRRDDGQPFRSGWVECMVDGETAYASAVRSIRGLVYARRYHAAAAGRGVYHTVRQVWVARLRVDILDRREERAHTLRLRVTHYYTATPDRFQEPSIGGDEVWGSLLHEAREGFLQRCERISPELRARYDALTKG